MDLIKQHYNHRFRHLICYCFCKDSKFINFNPSLDLIRISVEESNYILYLIKRFDLIINGIPCQTILTSKPFVLL